MAIGQKSDSADALRHQTEDCRFETLSIVLSLVVAFRSEAVNLCRVGLGFAKVGFIGRMDFLSAKERETLLSRSERRHLIAERFLLLLATVLTSDRSCFTCSSPTNQLAWPRNPQFP